MTPNTTVTLYATDFDITNKHVVYADSEGAALAAVSSFPSRVYTNCYWQRTDGFVFRATGNINDVERYNYCIFENNGKRNFAYITKCQYVNDDMTWVYLEIDPWLNFAGQYNFADSPMRRCHPETDTVLQGSYSMEPVSIAGWKQENFTAGDYAEGDADDCFLVCQIDTTLAPDIPNDLFDGIYNILLGQLGSAAQMIAWGSRALKSGATRIGAKTQPLTYHVTRGQAVNILNRLAVNGLSDKVVCAYAVPSYLGAASVAKIQTPLADINNAPEITEPVVLDWGGATIFWNKLKYSPQFNEFTINLCGNAVEIPWGYIKPNNLISGQLTVKINADMAMDGCATARLEEIDVNANQSSDFMVHSPTWDRVQMVGSGGNQNKLIGLETATIGGIIRAGMTIVQGNAVAGIMETATDIIGGTIDAREIVNAGTVETGGGGGSIAGFNMTAPLLNATHYYPKEPEIVKLQKYFGTYGYSWAGEVKPIVFNTLPHWNYYETMGAVITGRGVPQRYLKQVIDMFNRGVFVYNTIGDYKHLENAMSNHL